MQIKKLLCLVNCFMLLLIGDLHHLKYFNFKSFKEEFNQEINILNTAYTYLGIIRNIKVSDEIMEFDIVSQEGNIYLIRNDSEALRSCCEGIVINTTKYLVIQKMNGDLITYYDLETLNVKLYDLIEFDDVIGTLKYDKGYMYRISGIL